MKYPRGFRKLYRLIYACANIFSLKYFPFGHRVRASIWMENIYSRQWSSGTVETKAIYFSTKIAFR